MWSYVATGTAVSDGTVIGVDIVITSVTCVFNDGLAKLIGRRAAPPGSPGSSLHAFEILMSDIDSLQLFHTEA